MKSLFQELSGSFVPSSVRSAARKVTPLADAAEIESAEALLKKSKRMKALHADPEFKAKLSKSASARMKALHADPEFKAKAAARMKALHADPEFKAARARRKAQRIAKRIDELNKELAAANAIAEAA